MPAPKEIKKMLKFVSTKLYGVSSYEDQDADKIYDRYCVSGYSHSDIIKGSTKALGALKGIAFDYFKNSGKIKFANKHTIMATNYMKIFLMNNKVKEIREKISLLQPLFFREDIKREDDETHS